MPKQRSRNNTATATKHSPHSGSVRIIAGEWRSRKLPVADLDGLRPTGDRVKETLFNWIQNDVAGSHCLDLFSGSGALALEALSRGASTACLVDQAPQVCRQLKANLSTLKCTRGHVVHANSLDALTTSETLKQQGPYDLVFMDPPFSKSLVQSCIQKLTETAVLAASSWVYIETEAELQLLETPPNWTLHRSKKSGKVLCRLYQVSVN